MKSIILFRFYKNFRICAERVKMLKYFNPDLQIHGLFGGRKKSFSLAKKSLGNLFLSIRMISNSDPFWKWLHPDLALKEWYRNFGFRLSFDFLFDYEWDILTLASLKEIYPKINQKTIVLTGREILNGVKDKWDWTSKKPWKPRYLKFREYMEKKYGLKKQKYAFLGPGPYFSRSFIENFSKTEDNELVISEIAYPAYAQAMGYKILDTGFHPKWFSDEARKFFNCNDIEISLGVIKKELARPSGRKAFHPVKYKVDLKTFNLEN